MALRVALFLAAFLVLCGATVALPAIDLAASGLFYEPGRGFFLGDWLPVRLLRAAMPFLVGAIALAGVLLVATTARRPWRGLDWRAGVYLLLALALGPGLVVNALFKDHWGRARPAQIVAFGGTERFTPAFVPSDQCDRNCSFPAGDPANGFVLAAAGLLMAAPGRRRAAIAGAVGFGAIIGLARLAQGGHFLSDVLASGFLVFAITWLLHRWIIVDDGLPTLAAQLRHPSPALRRFLALTVLAAAVIAASYAWVDRPLALASADTDHRLVDVFRVVTMFGVSTGYLVAAAALALALALASARMTGIAQKRKFARGAWRAAYVFAAVGGAGLVGDVLKPVFGRARPRLLIADGTFGFTWHGAHAVYWSFPSGHAITIVALAGSLAVIERRGLPLYGAAALLVMASRLVLDEHYLSDVLAGAFIAGVATWAATAAFRRAGVKLALSDSP